MSGFHSYNLQKKRSNDGVLSSTSERKSTLGNVAMLASLGLEEAASSNELKMSDALRARFDRQHGYKMDQVRLVDSPLAKHLGTRGFAQGNVIHIASGAYSPHTTNGIKLISHEFSHVVQQATGRAAGLSASLSDGLEAEANDGLNGSSTAAEGSQLQALPAISAANAPIQAEGGLRKFLKKFSSAASGPKTISEQLATVPAISGFASSAKDKISSTAADGPKTISEQLASIPAIRDFASKTKDKISSTAADGPKTVSEQLASIPAIRALTAKAGEKLGAAKHKIGGAVSGAYRSFIKDPHQEAMDRLNANREAYDSASRWERFKFTAANPIARMRASGHKGDTESRKARYEALDDLAMTYKDQRKQLKQDRAQAAQEPTGPEDVDEPVNLQDGPQLDLEDDIPAPPQPTLQDVSQQLDADREGALSALPSQEELEAIIANRRATESSSAASLNATLQSLIDAPATTDTTASSQGSGPQLDLSLDDDTSGPGQWQRGYGGHGRPHDSAQTRQGIHMQNRKAQARSEALKRLAPLGAQSGPNIPSAAIGLGGMALKLGVGTGLTQIGSLAKNILTTYTGMGAGILGNTVGALNEGMNAERHAAHGNRSAALSSNLGAIGQAIGAGSTMASAFQVAETTANVPAVSSIVPGLGIATGAVQAARGAVDARMGAKTQKAMEGRLGSKLAEFKTAASQESGDAPVDFKRRFDKTTRHQIMMRNAAKRRKVGGAMDIAAGSTKAVASGAQLGLTLSVAGAPVGTAIGMGGTAVSGALGVAKTVTTKLMAKKHSAEALKLGYNVDVERAQVRRMTPPGMELSDKDVDYIVFKSRGIESGKESDALNIYYLRQAKKLKATASQEGPAGETARAMLREAGLSGKDLPLEGIAHVMGAPETISAKKATEDASLTRFQPSWKPKEPESEGPSIGSRISSGASGAWQSVRKKFSRTKSPAAAT